MLNGRIGLKPSNIKCVKYAKCVKYYVLPTLLQRGDIVRRVNGSVKALTRT